MIFQFLFFKIEPIRLAKLIVQFCLPFGTYFFTKNLTLNDKFTSRTLNYRGQTRRNLITKGSQGLNIVSLFIILKALKIYYFRNLQIHHGSFSLLPEKYSTVAELSPS